MSSARCQQRYKRATSFILLVTLLVLPGSQNSACTFQSFNFLRMRSMWASNYSPFSKKKNNNCQLLFCTYPWNNNIKETPHVSQINPPVCLILSHRARPSYILQCQFKLVSVLWFKNGSELQTPITDSFRS